MSIKGMMATACAALLSASAASAPAQDTNTGNERPVQGCCMSACARHGSATDGSGSGKMRCSLTGRIMGTCCCMEKEGKLHCTLAGKDVDTCCCAPVTDETDNTEKTDKTNTTDKTDSMDKTQDAGSDVPRQ